MLLSATTFANGSPKANSKMSYDLIEQNLLVGVHSENYGLKLSSVYRLGEMKSGKAVIPLLNILHTEKNEPARILAALSLYKIGDARGIYAVQRAAKFDDSERVRRMCANFYNEFVK